MTETRKSTAPLLEGISQYDVDFVIPRLGIDLPLGIDPFLMFQSRVRREFRRLHELITAHFNAGVQAVRLGSFMRRKKSSTFLRWPLLVLDIQNQESAVLD